MDAYARRLQAEIDTANERHKQHIGTSQILPYIQGLTVALELYKLFVEGDDFERPVDINKVWNQWTDEDRRIFTQLLRNMFEADAKRIKAGEVIEPHFTWYMLPPDGWRHAKKDEDDSNE